jgi:hypothetical protein
VAVDARSSVSTSKPGGSQASKSLSERADLGAGHSEVAKECYRPARIVRANVDATAAIRSSLATVFRVFVIV